MPHAGFFTCHNRFPENLWKPEFQQHENGATEIREVIAVADDPAAFTAFVSGLTASTAHATAGGIAASCGPHTLTIITPAAYADRIGTAAPEAADGARLAALVVATTDGRRSSLTPPQDAAGVAILWQPE